MAYIFKGLFPEQLPHNQAQSDGENTNSKKMHLTKPKCWFLTLKNAKKLLHISYWRYKGLKYWVLINTWWMLMGSSLHHSWPWHLGGGVKKGQRPDFFWENLSITTKVHFGVQKVLGGGDLSIESRLFLRNICHFEANLTFKSDFQSYFTFKKSSLMSPEMDWGGIESRKCKKKGGALIRKER